MGRGKGRRNRKAVSLHPCSPVPASPGSHSLRALERPRGPSQLGELPGCRCPAEAAASGLSGRIQVDSRKGAAPTPGLVERRGGVLCATNPGPPADLSFQMRHPWGARRRGNAGEIAQGAETKQPTKLHPPSAPRHGALPQPRPGPPLLPAGASLVRWLSFQLCGLPWDAFVSCHCSRSTISHLIPETKSSRCPHGFAEVCE